MSNMSMLPSSQAAAPRRRRARGRGANSAMSMLTGNTGDVKPQLLSFSLTQSAADTTTSVAQALPVLRNFTGAGANRAQIVEVLKVWFTWTSAAEVDSAQVALLGTKNKGTTQGAISDPDVFAWSSRQVKITTSGSFLSPMSECIDLSDGDGNGVLVATDNIYLQVVTVTTGVANNITVKILYRISGATVIEYVGIVQGQQ